MDDLTPEQKKLMFPILARAWPMIKILREDREFYRIEAEGLESLVVALESNTMQSVTDDSPDVNYMFHLVERINRYRATIEHLTTTRVRNLTMEQQIIATVLTTIQNLGIEVNKFDEDWPEILEEDNNDQNSN